MRAKIEKRSCTLCGERVPVGVYEQAQHLYSQHPALFFKNIVGSIPRLQQLGITITEAVKKGFQNGKL